VPYVRFVILAAALLAAAAPLPAGIVEAWYSRGLYPRLQPIVTFISALVPIALLDVAVVVLLAWALVAFARSWRRQRLKALRRAAAAVVVMAAAIYLWFLVFWGLNYRRVPLEQKVAYDQASVTREKALKFGWLAVEQVNALQAASQASVADAQDLVRSFGRVETSLGARRHARVAEPKASLLQWYFRTAAIDGMTNPFFLEVIVHPDLLPFERPFVLAHEWAHLAGYADESEANFVAWLACVTGGPSARYSGWLSAYELVSSALPREDRRALRDRLSAPVVADLLASSRRYARASPAVSTAARGAYDTYLRANRIEEGIASYSAAIRLMLGTSFDDAWKPGLRD
jgi:hypothetical protein